MTTVKAEGFFYDQATRDWTNRVVYEARNRAEALNWINFNRSWAKGLRIPPVDQPVVMADPSFGPQDD